MNGINDFYTKGSHNSYRYRHPSDPTDPDDCWDPSPILDAGCRSVELDIVQAGKDDCRWSVSHGESYQPDDGDQLEWYIKGLKRWSKDHPGHDLIHVCIDVKSASWGNGAFATNFDALLLTHLGRRKIVSVVDILGDASDLVTAVRDNGWRALEWAQDSFLFCFSSDFQGLKDKYSRLEPKTRLCLVDRSVPDMADIPTTFRKGWCVVLNVPARTWRRACAWNRQNPGFLTRIYGVDETVWNAARGRGAHILATDEILAPWATTGAEAYAATTLPGNCYSP